MKIRPLLVTALLLATLLAGCDRAQAPQGADALTGSFGVVGKGGAIEPFVKVEADSAEPGGYVLYEHGRDGWRQPKNLLDGGGNLPVRSFGKAELEKELKHSVSGEVVGLSAGGFAFIHVPAGWSSADGSHAFTTKTGYFALTVLGPVELVRMNTN